MDVVVTRMKKNGQPRIYHKQGCPYEKRILEDNKKLIKLANANSPKYCACKYCGGLQGDMKIHKRGIAKWERKYNMQFLFHKATDTLYLRTNVGFWKVFIKTDVMKYLLYHKNYFESDMSNDIARNGAFHRQVDVAETESLQKIVEYIAAHDRAKVIIADDYRKLPHTSKKQKKYYRSAEKRVKREASRRLDSIFRMLESKDETLANYSYC